MLDKTGTITARPAGLTDVVPLRRRHGAEAPRAAAPWRPRPSARRAPAGRGDRARAPGAGLALPEPSATSRRSPGGGVRGRGGRAAVLVGTARLMAEQGIDTAPADEPRWRAGGEGKTAMLVAVDGAAGRHRSPWPTRSSPTSAAAVAALARMGLRGRDAHRRQPRARPRPSRGRRHRPGAGRGAAGGQGGRGRAAAGEGGRSWRWSATASTTPRRWPRPTWASPSAPAPTWPSRPPTSP